MATSKRPKLRKNDRVTLSPIKRMIPAYDGKPHVLRDTVLTVSHLTGTGSQRNPWAVVVTDGTHFWHLEPDDVMPAEAHSSKRVMHATKIAGDAATQFTAGFDYVLKDWKAGMPWEQSIDLATTPANQRSHAFTSGARAAGDALAGWLDEARRKAKHFGLSESQREVLIEKSRYQNLFPTTTSHAKKSKAQLDREIAAALAKK